MAGGQSYEGVNAALFVFCLHAFWSVLFRIRFFKTSNDGAMVSPMKTINKNLV